MNEPRTSQDAQQAKQKFWRDYDPTQKMTFVMTVFTVIYSVTTIALFAVSYSQVGYLTKQQRPWVKVLSGAQVPDKGNTLTLTFVVIPGGSSPAKDISGTFYVERVKNGEEPQLNHANRIGGMTTGILFPDTGPQQSPITYDMLGSELDDFKEGRIFLVLYGEISYSDIFHAQHWTKFCQFKTPKTGTYTAQKCTAYNKNDEN